MNILVTKHADPKIILTIRYSKSSLSSNRQYKIFAYAAISVAVAMVVFAILIAVIVPQLD